MKQKEVFKKIGGIIKELNDQYEYLQTVTDDLNDLELELFVSNAHFLTDHIEILCKLNLQNAKVKKPVVEKTEVVDKPDVIERPRFEKPEPVREEKYFEPVVQQMNKGAVAKEAKTINASFRPVEAELTDPIADDEQPVPEIDLTTDGPEDTYSYIREEPETIRHELVLDETFDQDDDEPANEAEVVKEPSKRKRNEAAAPVEEPVALAEAEEPQSVEAEKNGSAGDDEILTINQKMSSQLGDKTSKVEQLSIKPISDIKLAITLNDKLLYVKDLFNGYNLAYSEAIEILNRFNTFEEAQRFLKTNYITKNNWESKPAATEKFYALLKRRYA